MGGKPHRALRSLPLHTEVQVGCHDLLVQTESPIKSADHYCKPWQEAGQGHLLVLRQRDTSEEDVLPHQERCCTFKGLEHQMAYTCL